MRGGRWAPHLLHKVLEARVVRILQKGPKRQDGPEGARELRGMPHFVIRLYSVQGTTLRRACMRERVRPNERLGARAGRFRAYAWMGERQGRMHLDFALGKSQEHLLDLLLHLNRPMQSTTTVHVQRSSIRLQRRNARRTFVRTPSSLGFALTRPAALCKSGTRDRIWLRVCACV